MKCLNSIFRLSIIFPSFSLRNTYFWENLSVATSVKKKILVFVSKGVSGFDKIGAFHAKCFQFWVSGLRI